MNNIQNNSREKICFPDPQIFSKISKILEKIGIKEDIVCAVLKEDEPSSIGIVLDLAKSFVGGKISEKDSISSLQKQLNVPLHMAESLFRDVKEEILPLAEKITVENQIQEEIPLPAIKKPDFTDVDENAKNASKMRSEKVRQPAEIFEEKNGKLPKKQVTPQAPRASEQDKYREPIG